MRKWSPLFGENYTDRKVGYLTSWPMQIWSLFADTMMQNCFITPSLSINFEYWKRSRWQDVVGRQLCGSRFDICAEFELGRLFRREISKDWWHKSSDKLLKQGIKLTDRDGIQWRPRLGCCWLNDSLCYTRPTGDYPLSKYFFILRYVDHSRQWLRPQAMIALYYSLFTG